MKKIEQLQQNIINLFGDKVVNSVLDRDELTITVLPSDLLTVMRELHDNAVVDFKQCQDVCGIDYLTYGNNEDFSGLRFAVVYHLLSIKHNWRIRVKCFPQNNDFPVVPSVLDIWNSVNWFEREAFDMFGIIFEGHPDLRRILTDYGFIGHPFRKDFPLSGYMEMRYDEEQKRVIYQPVTIEPRVVTPRTIREENYGG